MSETEPTLAPEVSPLLDADPSDLNTFIAQRVDLIFNKPPLMITDDELRSVVQYYRNGREEFRILSEQKALQEPKARRKAAPKTVKEALTASDDVDLL